MTGGAERVAHINYPPLRSLGLSILLGTFQITTFVYNAFCSCLRFSVCVDFDFIPGLFLDSDCFFDYTRLSVTSA